MIANELRIGNYYKPTDGSIEDYKEVTVDDLKAWSMGAIYGKPIPLTPEILEGCGSRKEDEFFYDESGEKIHKSDSYYWKFKTAKVHVRYFFTGEILCWIKYNMTERRSYNSDELCFYENQHIFREKDMPLHKFQNIIFALTGVELEVKLPVPA